MCFKIAKNLSTQTIQIWFMWIVWFLKMDPTKDGSVSWLWCNNEWKYTSCVLGQTWPLNYYNNGTVNIHYYLFRMFHKEYKKLCKAIPIPDLVCHHVRPSVTVTYFRLWPSILCCPHYIGSSQPNPKLKQASLKPRVACLRYAFARYKLAAFKLHSSASTARIRAFLSWE